MEIELKGRVIKKGKAAGEALATHQPISFYGGVDPETGRIIEKGHELEGENMAGRVLVFPGGKGSTVGSYVIYRLKKAGKAPAAIITEVCEPIVAVGAIIAEIPTVDRVKIGLIETGDWVEVDGELVRVNKKRP